MKNTVLLLFSFFMTAAAVADILHVPSQYPDIQSAIDAAGNGDTVLVDPGIYYGGFLINNKVITLCSQYIFGNDPSAIDNTALDGGNTQRVLEVLSTADTNYIIGLTIRNGYVFSDSPGMHAGGGIYASGNIVISHNKILNNIVENDVIQGNADALGGGIYSSGYCLVEGSLIAYNEVNSSSYFDGYGSCSASSKGGGLYAEKGLVRGNVFQNNYLNSWAEHDEPFFGNNSEYAMSVSHGGGMYIAQNGIIVSNIISSNKATADYSYQWTLKGTVASKAGNSQAYGGGIYGAGTKINNLIFSNLLSADGLEEPGTVDCTVRGVGIYGSGPVINNTITNNTWSNPYGGSYGIGVHGGSVENCIIWGNGGISEVYDVSSVTYTCIEDWGYPGIGNIYEGPQFSGTGNHPYSLSVNSPCIDAGNPATSPAGFPEFDLAGNPRFTDGDGNGSVIIDMGAYEFSQTILMVDFYANLTQTGPNQTIQFTSEITAINTEPGVYKWDFEDDGIIDSYEPNPLYAYPAPGKYDVRLTVTDTSGTVSESVVKSQYITISALEAGFAVNHQTGNAPLSVQFTDTSEAYYTQITAWKWDFNNDGMIDSQVQNPLWTYQEPGLYSVTLIILDATGLFSDTLTKMNYVTATMFLAGFAADQRYGKIPLTVGFSDTSICSYTQIGSWQWDFNGDNIIDSEEQHPEWIYTNTGLYTVSLIIKDTADVLIDTAKYVHYINACRLKAVFTAYPLSGAAPLTVSFTDLSQVEFTKIGEWEWDFNNDGIIDSGLQDPEYTYTETGVYSISLTITDTSGMITDYALLQDMIEVKPFVSIDERNSGISVEWYPNPFSSQLTVSINGAQKEVFVTIHDLFGNLIKEAIVSSLSDSVTRLFIWDGTNNEGLQAQNGLYLIRIVSQDNILATGKVLLQRR